MVRKLLVPMAASAILLAGCSTGGDLEKVQSDVAALQKDVAEIKAQIGISGGDAATAAGSNASDGSNAAQEGVYELGQQFVFQGVTYTVTESERKPQLDDAIKADDGYEFILYNIEIHNTSNEDYHYAQSDYSIVTGAGEIEDNYIIIDTGDRFEDLGNGDLATNGKRSGWVAFEVPQGDQPAELRYETKSARERASFKVKL